MRLPISDFQKGNDFGKKMNELKWMYASINREDFQEKIAFAEKLENVNIKCERFFDFFRFSIMHKRWSCFLVHYSHICHYIAASSFSNSSLLLQ